MNAIYEAAALLVLAVAGLALSLVQSRTSPHAYWKWFGVLCGVIALFSFLFLVGLYLLILSID